ncbi:glutathione ABC transporter substrate-binding protein [Alteribacter populi]|uniref:glutathione ABC transporter substrate-binding protein n=1 Tax=Alteribacter populi TaxID=2011011 RepID=UPI000BBADCF1|nr:glutathione ABC transporter substrate-binding protein [Alteribacter populi]
MLRSKGLKGVILSMTLSVVVVGCASEPEVGETTSDAVNEEERGQEGGNLEISVLSDASTLDPHNSNDVPSWNIHYNIYETLLVHDENMELQPNLATEWDMVEENVWEFKLQEGVAFHDGSDFNAEVVKANLDRVLDEEVASPNSFLFEVIDEINVVDNYTVQIITDYPYAPLPAHLAHMGSNMVSKEAIDADYEAMKDGEQPGHYISQNPTGTGYFEFESWDSGNEIVLTQFENYWGENAKVDQVAFKVVPEDLTRVGELESGSAHIIAPVTPSDVDRVENSPGVHVHENQSVSISYIGFNTQKEPFDNKKVRQALTMAVNKQGIMDGILEGTGVEAIGPVSEGVFGYSDNVSPLEYDPEKAKELLVEAGYEDGFETTIWTNDSREREDIAEVVQSQLGDIGVNVEIEVFEWGAYLDRTATAEHDMFILGLSAATGDADYPMSMLYHSDNVGVAGNRTFIENDEIDELLEKARMEGDEDERLAIYEEATELLIEEAPMLYLYHPAYLTGVSDDVQGFDMYENGLYQLQNVTIQ